MTRTAVAIQPTADMGLVRDLLRDRRAYAHMRNDAAPARQDFTVRNDGSFQAVLAMEDGAAVGVFLIVPRGAEAEIHFSFLPSVWGRTLELAQAFLRWTWIHTAFTRLSGPVPSYNRTALKLALAAGFVRCGIEKNAGLRHGKPFDRILTEAIRP